MFLKKSLSTALVMLMDVNRFVSNKIYEETKPK